MGSDLAALARWNRWGSADLAPGIPRDATEAVRHHLSGKEVIGLVGPRRAGKTTVLHQVMDILEARGIPREAVLHVNFEEPGFAPSLDVDLIERLYRAWREGVHPRGRGWLFLDEVQSVAGWERWVRARSETENLKIFVTGSSSALMSRELGTVLTGRHLTFRVHPLSFGEFLRFRGIEAPPRPRTAGEPAEIRHALSEFLHFGGFPEVVLAPDPARKEAILKQYFEDVLYRDVALRHEVRDLPTLRALAVHLMTQTASLIAYQRLSRMFGVSLDFARASCNHLIEAFMLDALPYFSLKAAERARHPRKMHAVDTGLRNVVAISGAEDRGRIQETASCAQLRRRGAESLHYWKGQGEVDFLVRRGTKTTALVQSCANDSGNAPARELAALAQAGEAFPDADRLLVADRGWSLAAGTPAGIRATPLWAFLLSGEDGGSGSGGRARSRRSG